MKQKVLALGLPVAAALSLCACSFGTDKIQEEGDTEEALMEVSAEETEESKPKEEAPQKSRAAILFRGGEKEREREASVFKEALDQEEIFLSVQYGGDFLSLQKEQLAEMIERDFSVIVIEPVDVDGLTKELEKAKEAGITILSYGELLRNSDGVDGYITFDHYEEGVYLAEQILSLAKEGKYTAKQPLYGEILAGAKEDVNSRLTYMGMMDTLASALEEGMISLGENSLTYENAALFEGTKGQARARSSELRKGYGADKPLNFCLGTTDKVTEGLIMDLTEASYQIPDKDHKDAQTQENLWPLVAGPGYSQSVSGRMLLGRQAYATYEDGAALAETCVQAILEYSSGKVREDLSLAYDNGVQIVGTYLAKATPVNEKNEEKLRKELG